MEISIQFLVRLGVIAASIIWGIWEQRLAIRNRRTAEGQVKDRGSFFRVYFSVPVGITVGSIFAFSGFGNLTCPIIWEVLGILAAVLGFEIRLIAMRTLAHHFTHRVTILKDHVLIRDGLYRWIRHPSYLGQIIIMVGLGCALANGFALIVTPIFTILAVLSRISTEERALSEHFGTEYESYRRTTARLIPGIW